MLQPPCATALMLCLPCLEGCCATAPLCYSPCAWLAVPGGNPVPGLRSDKAFTSTITHHLLHHLLHSLTHMHYLLHSLTHMHHILH